MILFGSHFIFYLKVTVETHTEERVTRATPARTGRIAVISPTLIGEVLTAQLSSPIQTGNTGILLYVTTGPAVESNESF